MKRYLTLHNIFLFAIIVVMPVLVAYYSISNMIEEQYLATTNTLSQELRQQIARVGFTSNIEYQLKDFVTTLVNKKKICRYKPEVLKDFIEDTDKLYPNVFKWLFLDENYNVIPIKSRRIFEATNHWKACLKGGIYVYNRIHNNGSSPEEYQEIEANYLKSRAAMQRMTGDASKPEHIFEMPLKPIKTSWLGKDCYVVWAVDTLTYTQYGTAKEMAGVCAIMIFPDQLPEDFWYKRLISHRKKSRENYQFPIAAININNSSAFVLDQDLPKDNNFVKGLIKAYNSRSKELFEYRNYIVGATEPTSESEVRMLSMVDLTQAQNRKDYMHLMLTLACGFLVLIAIGFVVYIKHIHFVGISLRQRIAAIFMIAIVLPLLSLISIGKTFISHEEGRLKESAFVKMRASIEALAMRYSDTPRLIELDLFNKLKSLIPNKELEIKDIETAMNKAVEYGLIDQYVFFKGNKRVATSWSRLEPTMEKSLTYMAGKVASDNEGSPELHENYLKGYAEDELGAVMKSVEGQRKFDFSRPSHLRKFVYLDMHLYFMVIKVVIDNQHCPLFVYLPDALVEKNFASREFTTNNIAAQEDSDSLIIPELSFYAVQKGSESFPPEFPIWNKLEDVLNRSAQLKIEETGNITVDGENFLYMSKPLSSMNTKAYLPVLLTSTRPIDLRVRDVSILLFALSAFALLGSILLSLVLSSSLLVPIKTIDSAAQQIGKGNLDVVLPEEGHDELSRLSTTFNEMVKGLREREKMQAYVSDSVLEAVKDDGDQSVHLGKHIEATILFSDVRNFTGLSESNPPDKIFETLNEFFGGVEPIIRMNHGRVDKYIGDAVMAIFHQTLPEHHALSAVKTAVKMKQYVSLMNSKRKQRGLFPIEIGIGISTGQVLLGDIGSNRRKDLTVIGDEVNLASRLETASKKGQHSKIIFSGQTYKIIEDLVEADKMPFEEIRGKKHAVQIYELIKFKSSEI